MQERLSFYLRQIERLRVDRTRGLPAPHKPLLLLTVLDLIERGEITDNRVEISPLLVETYLNYWKHIPTGQPRLYNPFPRLRTSGFWHLHARPGQESSLAATRSFQSVSHLTKLVAYASLDPELFMLLQRPDAREVVRQTIIETHLSRYRPVVESAASENQLINEAARKLRQEASGGNAESETVSPARSAAFRQEIMRLYDYTCAACRLRVITPDFKSAVDAAHIIRFADSHDDVINNGLALCKLHHWAFDEHLIAVSDSYTLLVSSGFDERGRGDLLLRNLKGKKILLPSQRPFYPSLINLRQHRAAFDA
jgi:putative restriction endonuclease